MAAGPRVNLSTLFRNLVVTLWAGSLALLLLASLIQAVVGQDQACEAPTAAVGATTAAPTTQPTAPATDGAATAPTAAASDAATAAPAPATGEAPTTAPTDLGPFGPLVPSAEPILEPVGTQPVTLALGRARQVRYARATFSLLPVAPESPDGAGGAGPSGPPSADATAEANPEVAEPPAAPSDASAVDAEIAGRERREYLAVEIGLFTRDDGTVLGGRPVAPGGYSTGDDTPPLVANAWSRRRVVTVELCVDRSGPSIGPPGTYTGSVVVVDPRVARTEVPFVVTMSYPHPLRVLALLYFVVLVAAVYVWMAREKGEGTDGFKLERFIMWLGTRTGMLAVGSGAVAAYVAYSATYLAASTWGGNVLQIGALVGAAFTAFITAATAVVAAAPLNPRSDPGADGSDPRRDG